MDWLFSLLPALLYYAVIAGFLLTGLQLFGNDVCQALDYLWERSRQLQVNGDAGQVILANTNQEDTSLSSVTLKVKELISQTDPEFASIEFLNLIELYVREKKISDLKAFDTIDDELVRRLTGDEESYKVLMDLFTKLNKISQTKSTFAEGRKNIEATLQKPNAKPPLKLLNTLGPSIPAPLQLEQGKPGSSQPPKPKPEPQKPPRSPTEPPQRRPDLPEAPKPAPVPENLAEQTDTQQPTQVLPLQASQRRPDLPEASKPAPVSRQMTEQTDTQQPTQVLPLQTPQRRPDLPEAPKPAPVPQNLAEQTDTQQPTQALPIQAPQRRPDLLEAPKPAPVPQNLAEQTDTQQPTQVSPLRKTGVKTACIAETVQRLGLESYFPEKISREDILQIRKRKLEQETLTETSVAWHVIRTIISCDAQGRSLVPETTSVSPQGMSLLNLEDNEEDDTENELNPMDVLLASYLCCDKEMQQMLCRALFACKLAFPFIYSTTDQSLVISSWSLRDIIVQFINEHNQYIETSLVSDYNFPVVSFLRIGELPVSKSKLLNSLLNGNSHETFFHRDCTNGHTRRVCSNGLVEATVFLPSKTSSITQAFLATNLRGDLLYFQREGRVVTLASQVIVIFVEVSNLSQPECLNQLRCMNESEVILVLYRSLTRVNPQSSETMDVIKTFSCIDTRKGRPEREILSEMQHKLLKLLVKVTKKQREIPASEADLDDGSLVHQAEEFCASIISQLTTCGILNIKNEHLPLQEKWMEYSRHFKKGNSSKAKDKEKQAAQRQCVTARQQQVDICQRLSPLMKEFLAKITELVDNCLIAKILIQSIRMFFDNASREHLPMLRKRQNELRKSKENASEACSTDIDDELRELDKKLMLASVGLENIFREAGQVFEAISTLDKGTASLNFDTQKLPKVIAQLLLCGVPLEILDGDAGNIPSTWISAILKSCQELVGDKKIYVISVLGLQSSGKSTLLNIMFGLKFAVSAGRCTRGAFLQLVPVESGMPFDYIAVIDTEGLRAPELGLDKHHHDNELATLVIGLGDVTIINIKGENAAEMKDILQISIHAFIRMKMANKKRDLRRHCIFIHQNVPAAGARELMQEATFKMQQTLDDMTKEAAEGEGLLDVKRFGDILEFNRDTDIFFMSDLWQGDPPMAPVNPGYSMDMQVIKQHLLQILDKDKNTFFGFADFSNRVKDLWKAILSEDFVFSFKNSIEMKAYNILENKFLEVTNHIEETGEEWLHKSAAIPIRKCESVSAVADIQQKAINELRSVLATQEEEGVKSLTSFLDENKYREYTIQWKERKLASLRDSVKSHDFTLRKRLQILCDGQKVELEQGPRKAEWESRILKRATELALQLREMPQKSSILQEFETLWQDFISQLPTERTVDFEEIESQATDYLRKVYPAENHSVNIFLSQFPLKSNPIGQNRNLTEILFPKDDLVKLFDKKRSFFSTKEESFSDKKRKLVSEVFSEILKSVQSLLIDMRSETTGFSNRHLVRIRKSVCEAIKNSSSSLSSHKITPTTAFEIKVVVIALCTAYPTFVEIHRNFYEANSMKTKLANEKKKMRNLFENIVYQQTEAKIAADFCRDHLETVMKQAIQERMAGKLKGIMLNEIGRTKYQLIVRMLTDMAQRGDFAAIIEYVRDSHTSALKWLTQFINHQLFQRTSDGESVFANHLESLLIVPIVGVAEKAAKSAAAKSPSIESWIDIFCKEVEKELAVLPRNLQHISQYNSVKVQDILPHLLRGLTDLRSTLVKFYADMDESKVKWHGDCTLYSDVLQSLWGCTEQCPFCSEPCFKSQENHFEKDGTPHGCIQHRPKGVDGVYINSDELVFDTCEWSVNSDKTFSCGFCKEKGKETPTCQKHEDDPEVYHPYREYKKYFPEWEIDPDAGNLSATFWSWFSWTFQNELKVKHGKGIARLPPAWSLVSKIEAIDSLRALLD